MILSKEDLVVSTVGLLVGVSAIFAGSPVDENSTNPATKNAESTKIVAKINETKTSEKYNNATSLTDKELKDLLRSVGFKGQELRMAWAIAKKESNGRPLAFNHNTSTGDHSFGLFQINMVGDLMDARIDKFDLQSVSDLFNPVTNAEVAYYMSKGGKDWHSWTDLKGERFKSFYSEYLTVN